LVEDIERIMSEAGQALADAVEAALPGWVRRSVEQLLIAWLDRTDPEVLARADLAGQRAGREVGARIRGLVSSDLDDQTTTPLSIVRQAVSYPADVLDDAGIPEVERDEFAQRRFPGDRYGLSPASWADIDPALTDVGLAWGAAKALAHRHRHAPPHGPGPDPQVG